MNIRKVGEGEHSRQRGIPVAKAHRCINTSTPALRGVRMAMILPYSLLMMILRPVWRMQRGLTLGVQGCVVNAEGQILLVQHGYRPGWHFPGGGVEWGETLETSLARELQEEVGVELSGPTQLHGVFANFKSFPGDHVALYVARQWHRPKVPAPNAEIVASGWYAPAAMPAGTSVSTLRRVHEIFGGQSKAAVW